MFNSDEDIMLQRIATPPLVENITKNTTKTIHQQPKDIMLPHQLTCQENIFDSDDDDLFLGISDENEGKNKTKLDKKMQANDDNKIINVKQKSDNSPHQVF